MYLNLPQPSTWVRSTLFSISCKIGREEGGRNDFVYIYASVLLDVVLFFHQDVDLPGHEQTVYKWVKTDGRYQQNAQREL